MMKTANDYFNHGIYLAQNGKLAESVYAFCQTIQLEPQNAKPYNNLGLILHKQGKLSEAEAMLKQAIELDPNDPSGYTNLSLILLDSKQPLAAIQYLETAIKLNPGLAPAHNDLGVAYEEINRFQQAKQCYQQAIRLQPRYAEAHFNLGVLLKALHQLTAAEVSLQKAIELRPTYEEAKFELATLQLLQGKYAAGWETYDALRLKRPNVRAGQIPLWQNESLACRRLLLFYEQGFGDTLQFIRYADLVAKQGGAVTLWVQETLKSLITFSYPECRVVSAPPLPDEHYDYACSLMSLPKILHTLPETIPRNIPYLRVDPAIQEKWRLKLAAATDNRSARKVGVVWSGNPLHHNDHNRSIPFSDFQGLLTNAKIIWVSLQTGPRAVDAQSVPEKLIDFSGELTDFSQTAGLIANLDLVITVDSAVAHLAGGLGKPTWIFIPFVPDWRWQIDRRDSLWYPNVRLFRQTKPHDWRDAIAQMNSELQVIETLPQDASPHSKDP